MLAAEVENLPLCRELLLVYAVDQVTASNKVSFSLLKPVPKLTYFRKQLKRLKLKRYKKI